MNREQIMQLEGRELDTMVGAHVMGLDIVEDRPLPHMPKYYLPEYERTIFTDVPKYSTDISAAWEVLKKFHSHRLQKLEHDDKRVVDGKVHQCFINKNANCAYGHTVTEAICRAALLAVMEVET